MMFVFYDNSNWKLLFVTIITLFFGISCEDDVDNSTADRIPLVIVDKRLHVDDFEFIPLQTVGGFISIPNTGYRGIIVYNTGLGYVAYERACPYDVEKDCARVEVDDSRLFLIDKCCKTSYNWDGTILSGPGNLPLKKYLVSFDARKQELYITN